MKRVIVETVNNKVMLHFHPKIARDDLIPSMRLDIEIEPLNKFEIPYDLEKIVYRKLSYFLDYRDNIIINDENDLDSIICYKIRILMLYDMLFLLKQEGENQLKENLSITFLSDFECKVILLIHNLLKITINITLFT